MTHQFLVHRTGDHVGVAVAEISPGASAGGVFMDTGERATLTSRSEIPLGHKIALTDLEPGSSVIEYGAAIGRAVAPILAGELVHTHNIKTARWSS